MTPGDAAQHYASRGWPVFPCCASGPRRKQPLVSRGFHDASTDPVTIERWWTRWPDALAGLPTGRRSALVVLDIDVKNPKANGFHALEELGLLPLPASPMVHTAGACTSILPPAIASSEIRPRSSGPVSMSAAKAVT